MVQLLLFLLMIPIGLFAGLPHQNSTELQTTALDELDLETYTTWTPDGVIPQVFSVTSDEHMNPFLADQSERMWLVQNEPERLMRNNGSETAADVVAAALQGVEQSFACCGVMVDEAGLQWLDAYLAAGGPIPDAWHVHIYQTWSGGWSFAANRFQNWMVENGVERPVVVSETSAAHAPLSMQMEVMQTAFDTMQANEWLTTIIWFSIHHTSVEPGWSNAQLVDDTGKRTIIGDLFVRLRNRPTPTPEANDAPIENEETPDAEEPSGLDEVANGTIQHEPPRKELTDLETVDQTHHQLFLPQVESSQD